MGKLKVVLPGLGFDQMKKALFHKPNSSSSHNNKKKKKSGRRTEIPTTIETIQVDLEQHCALDSTCSSSTSTAKPAMMADRNPSETTMRTSCSSFVTTGSSDRSVFRGNQQQHQYQVQSFPIMIQDSATGSMDHDTIITHSSSSYSIATHSTVATMGSPSSYLSLSSPTRPMLRRSLLRRSATTEGRSPPRGLSLLHPAPLAPTTTTRRSSFQELRPNDLLLESSSSSQDNSDDKISQSFRLRKRNRAWSNQDFECRLDIGHGAWTATIDRESLDATHQERRVRRRHHNDRTKNHAYAQLDFERFIFDTRGDLEQGESVVDGSVLGPVPLRQSRTTTERVSSTPTVSSSSSPTLMLNRTDSELSREEAVHPLLRQLHPPTVSQDDDDDYSIDVVEGCDSGTTFPGMDDSTLSATMASF